ncbi:Syndetin [Amphibalanus amphitrite]|uniref:Syndetin n=1 Tax=Amphibalanus amphitrite TaxID=1232801 RepID=A0A6A4WQM8_AMPAM|nr:Syndetin [Amphibalanus amphitrite]
MDDLKEKFKTLMNKPSVLPAVVSSTSDVSSAEAVERRVCVSNDVSEPEAEQAVLDSIQGSFFQTVDSSEVCREQLQRFPPTMDVNLVNGQRQILRRQLTVVSKKVSDMILHCQPEHSQELERVMLLQEELLQTLAVCQTARQSVRQAQAHFTAGGLGVLANYRHRQALRTVLRPLHTIRTLQMTEARLEELLRAEDYPGCIHVLQECLKVAAAYRQFSCVSDMTNKLQDTLDMVEEQLDVGLGKLCTRFDAERYSRLQEAYRLLGKTQTAADQLLMHMTSAVHTASGQQVLAYVQSTDGAQQPVQKRQYPDLCALVPTESVLPCLRDLCRVLWNIIYNYHCIFQWHRSRTEAEAVQAETESAELSLNRRYVAQKLEHGRSRIWLDVQGRVRAYLLAAELSHFSFDDFIQILDVVHRLLEIGAELSGQEGGPLEEAVKKQCVAFIHVYHRARLEELRMFLENEAWEVCPVKPTFSVHNLQEFKHLRRQHLLQSDVEPEPRVLYLKTYDAERNPFDVYRDAKVDGEQLPSTEMTDSDSDDESEELKVQQVEEAPGDGPHRQSTAVSSPRRMPTAAALAPPVSSTALHVLRLCGRYLRMMALLRTVALDVVVCLSQLFDFYLYTVYSLFAPPDDVGSSPRLVSALQRISDQLIERSPAQSAVGADPSRAAGGSPAPPAGPSTQWSSVRVPPASLNPAVELHRPERLHGLAARLVAAESVVFIADQLELIRRHVEGNIPQSKRLYVQQFYGQTVAAAADVRGPVYFPVTSRVMDSDVILMRMANVNWEVKELCSQHSAYVDLMLRDLQVFSMRLEELGRRLPVPRPVYDTLWDQCVRVANRAFVEGFASARRCSNEGRALMQLDYQQFVTKLERLTRLRPLPERNLVETYVKAYYVPESGLDDWIRQHKEYTKRQVTGLIGCMSHVGKRARTRLLGLLEEDGRR